jgi:hypothetical protein
MRDLRTPPKGYPRFNMNFEFYKDTDGVYVGDAALYLVYRYKGPLGIEKAYKNKDAPTLMSELSGIPKEDCELLVWGNPDTDLDYETVTATEFITVLKHYIDVGEVNWDLIARD